MRVKKSTKLRCIKKKTGMSFVQKELSSWRLDFSGMPAKVVAL